MSFIVKVLVYFGIIMPNSILGCQSSVIRKPLRENRTAKLDNCFPSSSMGLKFRIRWIKHILPSLSHCIKL